MKVWGAAVAAVLCLSTLGCKDPKPPGYTIYMYPDSVRGLHTHSAVEISGVMVGVVDNYRLTSPPGEMADGQVIVELIILNDIRLPLDSHASVEQLAGGGAVVAIEPGRAEGDHLQDGDTIQVGSTSPTVDDVIE